MQNVESGQNEETAKQTADRSSENKIRAYLGFSLRNKTLTLGTDGIEALKKGVRLLIADETIGATAKKRLIACAAEMKCPLYLYRGNIGEFISRPAVKAAALKDKNLADALEKTVRANEQWKLYSGGEL